MEKIKVGDIEIVLSKPISKKFTWIGQDNPAHELTACWLTISDEDLPLTPRIVGLPGVGKTTLAAATAQRSGRDVYIMQCTADTRPEDLIITPVLSSNGNITYHASPLLSAVITGGTVILDEGNRMSEKSWASLAGLLDDRRTVESIVAGVTINAHRDFRTVVTMNEDSSTFEIPDYIISRLQPQIKIDFPDKDDELSILKYNIPFASDQLFDLTVQFLQNAHTNDLTYSIRDGLNAIRLTIKKSALNDKRELPEIFEESLKSIIGVLNFEKVSAVKKNGFIAPPDISLGDIFFADDEDDDINPDYDFGPEAS